MYDRAAVRYEIFQRLNKSPKVKGFYTNDRCNSAIQEALDYVATEMMLYDGGWEKKLDYIDVEANQLTIPVPPHMEMIEEVRYLVGNVYTPMIYDSNWNSPEWSPQSGATSLPTRYRIIDNKFYFNPPIGVGGEKFLAVEYQRFPSILRDDAQQIDPQFNRAMMNFVIYRASTILANTYGISPVTWADTEAAWYEKMLMLIEKRSAQSRPISDFAGY